MLPEDGWKLRDARSPLPAWDHRVTGEAWARGPKTPTTPMGEGVVLWWRRDAVGGSIVTNGTDELFCSHPETDRLSFCFDLNGRLNWGWSKQDGSGSVWHYFDDLLGDYNELELPLVLDLCCATDHYRTEGVDSGVVIAYTRGNALLVRNQVDRYQSEHVHLILAKPVPLRTCGMSPEWRFSFRFEDRISEGTEWQDPLDSGNNGGDDWEGGLGGVGGAGWYRYGTNVPAQFNPIEFPWDTGLDVQISSTEAPETAVSSIKAQADVYVDAYGLEEAKVLVRNSLQTQYGRHPNMVRPGTVVPWPVSPFSGQPDAGAASTWNLGGAGTGASWVLVYGVDQEQVYLDLADLQQDWHPPTPPALTGVGSIYLQFQGCEGPSCPTSYGLDWAGDYVTEINFDAIVDWIFEDY